MQQKWMIWWVVLLVMTITACSDRTTSTSATSTQTIPIQATIQPKALATCTVAGTFATLPTTPVFSYQPLREDIIILNFGYEAIPDTQVMPEIETWTQQVSKVAGLNIIAKPGPVTDMEILHALRDGRIHMAELNALAFGYGLAQGWIVPGPVKTSTYRQSGSIMFIARTDTGLTPGEPPEVFQQLTGKHPCWPDISQGWYRSIPPLYEYILPAGLLSQANLVLGQPEFITYSDGLRDGKIAVFLRECDFAVEEAMPEKNFLMLWSDYLASKGATIDDWAEQMQVIYTTPPLEPPSIMVFSNQIEPEKREQITKAILNVPSYYPEYGWLPYDESQEALYDRFQAVVDASGVNVAEYLSRQWDHYLQSFLDADLATSPSPTITSTINLNTLVIDTPLTQGGQPWLPFVEQSSDYPNLLVLPAIYGELVRLDFTGSYFPYLAQELPTRQNGRLRFVGQGEDEYLEVEFQLRPGLTWQDGQPLTAADLVFSWEYVMQPDWLGSHYGESGLAAEIYIQEVQALAPDRVVYRFMSQRQARQIAQNGGRLGNPGLYAGLVQQEGPVVPLDYLSVGRNVFPKHLLAGIPVSRITSSDFARRPVYAGAYKLVEGGSIEQTIVLEAFDGFALGTPPIPRVVFGLSYADPVASTYWQTPEQLAAALEAGLLQAQLGLPAVKSRQGEDPQAYDALADQGLARVTWVPRYGWETFDFNLDNPHLSDLRVRQAIAHAIDRQAIIDLALNGHGSLMRSYLPPTHPLYAGDEALPDYDYDPEEARSLLLEAGYDLSQFPAMHPTLGPLSLKLASMDVASYPRPITAELIREELKIVGIDVQVQFYEWLDFEADDCSGIRNSRQFDLGMAGWRGGSPFPIWYVEHVTASWSIPTEENGCRFDSANWTGWINSRADEIIPMLNDGRLALENPDEYLAVWHEHQQLWANELPSIPLFNWQRPVVTAPGLQGVQGSLFAFGGVEDTWNISSWVFDPGN